VDVVLDRIARAVMMIEAHVAMMTVAHVETMKIDARAVMTIAPIREPMRNEKAMRSSVASVSVA
jgi:hypothetical protein